MKITEYSIKAPVEKPLKAAFISDTHDKPYGKVVDKIKSEHVDLILCTGDIIYGHNDKTVYALDMLRELVKIAPVFMSLGNHEGGAVKKVRRNCKKIGVTLLENDFVEFEGIMIGGLTSGLISNDAPVTEHHWQMTPPPDLEWLKAFSCLDGFKLLLNHHPEYYPVYIKDLNIDLTLSGHAHGGQCRFFGRGLFAPGQGLFPKYTSGMHDGRFIISQGLANNAPPVPRLFNPKELIFINFSR